MENNYDSIVIGSGIGGLSCALSLAILKHRVLLIEQYDKIGGYLNPFSYTYGNKEYLWDYGFQYGGRMTKGNIEYDLLNYLTDGSMTFPRFDKKFQLFKCFDFPGVRDFEYNTDDNTVKPGEKYGDFTKMLLREYPEEQEAIKTFWSYLNKIQKHLEDLVKPKIFCYFLANLLYPIFTFALREFKHKSLGEVLDSLTNNKELRIILSSYWTAYGISLDKINFVYYGGAMNYYDEGAYYFKNTTKSIIDGMKNNFVKHKGDILTNTIVKEIILKGNKAIGVALENDEIYAKNIISDIGMTETVNKLLPYNKVPQRIKDSLKKYKPTVTSFVLCMLFKKDIIKSFNIEKKAYRVFAEKLSIEDDPTLENWTPPHPVITFPSVYDDDNYDYVTCEIFVSVLSKYFDKYLENYEAYKGEYEKVEERVTNNLINKGLLRWFDTADDNGKLITDYLVYKKIYGPVNNNHQTLHYRGANFGLTFSTERANDMNLIPKSGIRHMYFTGADVFSPGVLQSMMAGVLTANSIVGIFKNLFKEFKKK